MGAGDVNEADIGLSGLFGGSVAKKFSNPYLLPSSDYFPSTLSSAFDYCRYLYYAVPLYKEVAKRTVRYFITDFEFPGRESSDEKAKVADYLRNGVDIIGAMCAMGDEGNCYGNSFYTIYYPFVRELIDTRNGEFKTYEVSSIFKGRESQIKFDLNTMTYEVPDPKNGFQGTVKLKFRDKFSKDKSRIKLIQLDPRDIRIKYNRISGKPTYIYILPQNIVSQIKQGFLHAVHDTPRLYLEAVAKGSAIQFDDDAIFHYKLPILSGLSYNYWGLSPLLANFRAIYQILVYSKTDEAVALDHSYPFRVMSPAANNANPIDTSSLHFWKDEMSKMIARRRKDLFAIHASTWGVNMQEFGVNGKSYVPKDIQQMNIDTLLNCCGYPANLFNFTLDLAIAPTALRLLQQNFWEVYNNFNKFCKWFVRKYRSFMGEPVIEINLQQPRMADNLELLNIKMQLVQSRMLPYAEMLKDMGITDAKAKILEAFEEDLEIEKEKSEKEQDMAKAQQSQELLAVNLEDGQGGMVADQGSTGILSDEEQAMEIAKQWFSIQDNGERKKSMESLETTNPVVHALAQQYLKEIRADARNQGLAQAKEQAAGGQQ